MIKTVKGKVIAGTVAVTLFAGSGVAFGATDAGTKFQTWYNNQFKSEKSLVESDAETKVNDLKTNLETIYKGRQEVASSRITEIKKGQIGEKNESINAQAQEHITLVNSKKAEISSLMKNQFDELLNDANKLIQKTGDQELNKYKKALPEYTKGLGDAAILEIEQELQETTRKAVSKLEAAIIEAQNSLLEDLDTESGLTKDQITAKITAKTAEVRSAIVEQRNELVIKQKELIEKAANKLDKDAEKQLQDIVNGI